MHSVSSSFFTSNKVITLEIIGRPWALRYYTALHSRSFPFSNIYAALHYRISLLLYLIHRNTSYFVTVPLVKDTGALSWRCVRILHWPMVNFRCALLQVVMETRESTVTLPFPCASPFFFSTTPLGGVATGDLFAASDATCGGASREDRQLMGRDVPP